MLTTREDILRFIEHTGHEEAVQLRNMELEFGIEFNVCQYQSVINRDWGKTYLSWAIALYQILEQYRDGLDSGQNILILEKSYLDPDCINERRRRQWIDGFIEFCELVGYKAKKISSTSISLQRA